MPSNKPFRSTLTSIKVSDYKSLCETELIIRPLTLLAGANSSGKSSIMQPLLLIKQTMDESFQSAGALVLNGPHVQITDANQIVSKVKTARMDGFTVRLESWLEEYNRNEYIELSYQAKDAGFILEHQISPRFQRSVRLTPQMPWSEIKPQLDEQDFFFLNDEYSVKVSASSSFLNIDAFDVTGEFAIGLPFGTYVKDDILGTLHIPGLRGIRQRTYPSAAFKGARVRGTFDVYAAGIIRQWQEQKDTDSLQALNEALVRLGLTRSVKARTVNANEVEIQVGRLPAGGKGKDDLVNIADVGFGVSQVLPVVLALVVAEPGQLVYIEQPELHLHPKAQVVMAALLADAARRGVRVIVETHSSLLLLTLQTLIAEGKLPPTDVAMHWFSRDKSGATQITLADVDENGSFGSWPVDFGDVELNAQRAYLEAVTNRQFAA